jgi:hypothetical protein
MSTRRFDNDKEPPLDPTLLRVQARLRRLMMIGGLTLGLGIGAVLLAIVYRLFFMDSTAGAQNPGTVVAGEVTAEAVGLPPGAELISVALDGDRMARAFRDGADTVTVVVDTTTMAVVGRFRVAGP